MEGSSQSVQISDVKVSVVQVSFFTGEVLWDSIESVLRQEGVELELILVNNGNPPEVVTKLQVLETRYKNFTLLSGHGNVGFGKACNLGASLATAEHLLFVNPDCVMFPDCVSRLLAEAESKPKTSILGGNLFGPDGTVCENTHRDFPTPGRLFIETLKIDKLAPNHPYMMKMKSTYQAQEGTRQTSVVSGALMMIRKETFEALKGFDEAYFLHVEDIDICLRLHLSGGNSYFCSEAKAVHFKSSSQVSWYFVEKHKARGFRIFFKKHFSKSYPRAFIQLMSGLTLVRLSVLAVVRPLSLSVGRTASVAPAIESSQNSNATAW